MPETILVMGGGTFQVGLIRFLKQHHYEVHVVANDLMNNRLPLADFIHHDNYLDFNRLLEIIAGTNAIQLLLVASEAGLIVQAKIQQLLGWKGLTTDFVDLFADKFQYKELLHKHKIPVPQVLRINQKKQFESFTSQFPQGVVLKPTKGSGSKGVFYRHHGGFSGELPDYLVEEYIDGIEYGGDFMVGKSKVIFYYPTVKSKNENWVPTGHVILQHVEDYQILLDLVNKVTERLILPDGVYNVDIVVSEGKPFLIDFSPRIGGNCIPDLMQFSWQVNEWQYQLEILLNGEITPISPNWSGSYGVYIIGTNENGKLHSFLDHQFDDQEALVEVFWKIKIGEEVLPFDEGANHIGYVIYKAGSDKEVLLLQKKIESFRWFELKPTS